MHIGCEELDDLLDHPLWSKALLVPPNSDDTKFNVSNEITMENVTSLNIAGMISTCSYSIPNRFLTLYTFCELNRFPS